MRGNLAVEPQRGRAGAGLAASLAAHGALLAAIASLEPSAAVRAPNPAAPALPVALRFLPETPLPEAAEAPPEAIPEPIPEPVRDQGGRADTATETVPVEPAATPEAAGASAAEAAGASAAEAEPDDSAVPRRTQFRLDPSLLEDATDRAIGNSLDALNGGPPRFSGEGLQGFGYRDYTATVDDPFESSLPPVTAFQPTRSRSRLVRRIGRICQELTDGGFALFGFIAMCTDANGRRDLFDDVRPAYLDEVPECRQVELSPAAQAMAIDAGLPTEPVKCRFVARDERYASELAAVPSALVDDDDTFLENDPRVEHIPEPFERIAIQ